MIHDLVTTPYDAKLAIGRDLKRHRLARNLTQRALARMSGVSEASLKRIEASGSGSLEAVLLLAWSLDLRDVFRLPPPRPHSIDDIVAEGPGRRRASRRKA